MPYHNPSLASHNHFERGSGETLVCIDFSPVHFVPGQSDLSICLTSPSAVSSKRDNPKSWILPSVEKVWPRCYPLLIGSLSCQSAHVWPALEISLIDHPVRKEEGLVCQAIITQPNTNTSWRVWTLMASQVPWWSCLDVGYSTDIGIFRI